VCRTQHLLEERGEGLGIQGLPDSLATSTLGGLDHDGESDPLCRLEPTLGIGDTGFLVNIVGNIHNLPFLGVALHPETCNSVTRGVRKHA